MSEDSKFKVNDKRGEEKQAPVEKQASVDPQVAPQEEDGSLPEASFVNFIASLGTSCMMHLGLMENPHTKTKEKSLDMAKHEIDLLAMLEEKSKGNLDDKEKGFLTQILYELRMYYVEASK